MKKGVLSLIVSLLAMSLFAASETVNGIRWSYKSIIFLKYFFRGALPLTPQPSKHTKTPHLVVQPGEMELLNLNLFNRLVSSTSLGNKLIYAQP